ncbi:sensor histidine kinase [Parafrankia sp. FMc2]|uniref:sensor histidine kinase n=1 Tax=Parafrankia sp. FMc2 TaxID=3233196 RepID=UPI0034D3AE1F
MVELVTTGDLGAVPAEVDLAAYRVVQESLTNVLRHAGPAEVRVALHSAGGQLRIEVRDRPAQAPAAGSHGATLVAAVGHGLRGLRERVEELGGSLTAGPWAAGGWRVHTELPLGPGPTARRTTAGAATESAGAPGAPRTAGVESTP